MKVVIAKRYWYFHENSDCVFTATRKEHLAASGSAEFSFIHELGPVGTGTKEEGENFLRVAHAAQDVNQLYSSEKSYWYYSNEFTDGLRLTREEAKIFKGPYAFAELGEVVTGTQDEFNTLLDQYLPF